MDTQPHPTFKSTFLLPIIVALIISAIVFFGEIGNSPYVISQTTYYFGPMFIVMIFAIVIIFMAGGQADLFGVPFNGWYLAAIPTGLWLGLLFLGILSPVVKAIFPG
jgi:hypothetical protein